MLYIQPLSHRAASSSVSEGTFACGLHGAGGGAAWVSARGALDLAGAPRFTRTLREALGRALLIIIDIRQLTFIDSGGIHAIVDADLQARRTGHRVVIIRGAEPVHRVFALAGVTDHLRIVDLSPGVDHALAR